MNNPFEAIDARLSNIESLLLDLKHKPTTAAPDGTGDLLNIQGAANITGFAKSTLYNLVSRNEIPHIKKRGKLYFSKQELHAWIVSGKGKTIADAERAADQSLSKLKS